MTQLDRIAKARMNVILSAPFFGTLLMRLPMVCDNSIPTFCTDGKRIKFNEEFCAALSDGEVGFALVHEVAHCALGHLWRMGKRDGSKWNLAADHAVNKMLRDYLTEDRAACTGTYIAPWAMPNWCELPGDNTDLSAEERYARMPDQPQPPKNGGQKPENGGQPGAGKPDPKSATRNPQSTKLPEGADSIGEM